MSESVVAPKGGFNFDLTRRFFFFFCSFFASSWGFPFSLSLSLPLYLSLNVHAEKDVLAHLLLDIGFPIFDSSGDWVFELKPFLFFFFFLFL